MKKAVASRKRGDTAVHSSIDETAAVCLEVPRYDFGSTSDNLAHFIRGAASILDIAGSQLPYPCYGSIEKDFDLIKSDFSIIGEDLKQILNAHLLQIKE